jgi:hypothetical protein
MSSLLRPSYSNSISICASSSFQDVGCPAEAVDSHKATRELDEVIAGGERWKEIPDG